MLKREVPRSEPIPRPQLDRDGIPNMTQNPSWKRRAASFKRCTSQAPHFPLLSTPNLSPLRDFSHGMSDAFIASTQPTLNSDASTRHVEQADAMSHPDTTTRETWAWYIYDLANGAFFFSVLAFLPVLITAQAAATAKENYCGSCPNEEWANNYEYEGNCFGIGDSCGNTGPNTNTSCVLEGGKWSADWHDDAIDVSFFGIPGVGYASVALACTSVSVVLQLIMFLATGSLADYGSLRKRMMLGFHLIGCLSCVLVLFSFQDGMYWFSGLMYIIGNVSFGSAVIFYNAYLPLLVGAHPEVRNLVREHATDEDVKDTLQQISNHMSAKGFAVGFIGQSVILLLNLGLIAILDDDKLAVRINTTFAGIWAFCFGTYSIFSLKERPSPPFPEGSSVIQVSIERIKKTFWSIRQLKEMFKFLFAYFIYSDGTGTIGASAAIFAAVELRLSALQIMYGVLTVSFLSGLSCVLFMYIHTTFNIKPKTILLFNLFVLGLIPIYGFFALRCQWEFYLLTAVFGLMYGSEQTFTRALFANGIPHGHESEYFALFEVTDKGTAWLGPLVVAAVFSATGSFRFAFLMLVCFFIVGFAVLLMFDPEKGDKERITFELLERKQLLEAQKTSRPETSCFGSHSGDHLDF